MNNSQKSFNTGNNNNKHINANIINKTNAQNKRLQSVPNGVFVDSTENKNDNSQINLNLNATFLQLRMTRQQKRLKNIDLYFIIKQIRRIGKRKCWNRKYRGKTYWN